MGTSGERAPVRQQTCPSPSNIIVKFMEKNLDMAKPHYGEHMIYCQSLDPSLYLRSHCNIVYIYTCTMCHCVGINIFLVI